MLVYLDTAHFDQVERLVLTSPPDAREFFARWRDAGYELALSYHHVEEFAQLSSEASIKRRLAVLWEFPGLRYAQPGSEAVQSFEIQTQLLHLAGVTTADYAHVGRALFRRAKPEVIEWNIFGALEQLRKGRLIHQGAADIDNLLKPLIEKLRESGLTRSSTKQLFTQELAERWFEFARSLDFLPERLRPFDEDTISSAARDGLSVREAAIRIRGLADVDAATIRLAPDSDLGELGLFFWFARHTARAMEQVLGLDEGQMTVLVPKVNPYNCPGVRLRLALLRARASAPKKAEPSDNVDAYHLLYAAHTDLAFVDRRTLGFLRQAARRRDGLLPEAAIRHIRKSSSLDDLFSSS